MNKYLEKIAMSPTLKRVAADAFKDYSKYSPNVHSQILQRLKEGRGLANFTQSNLKKPVSVLGNKDFVDNLSKFHPHLSKGVFSVGDSAKVVTDSLSKANSSGLLVGDQMKAQSIGARLARMKARHS